MLNPTSLNNTTIVQIPIDEDVIKPPWTFKAISINNTTGDSHFKFEAMDRMISNTTKVPPLNQNPTNLHQIEATITDQEIPPRN